jgi:5-formyltetrahydrofolate cyclo-ligase
MPGVSDKTALRRAFRASIEALDPDRRRADEAALIDRLLGRDDFQTAPVVLLTAAAFPEEIGTRPLIDAVLASGRALVLPRVDRAQRRLVLHRVDDPATQLVPATLGIPEPDPSTPTVDPAALDWVLVPGLGFDRDGFRLGRGGGYYDRLLATLPPHIPCWSIAFDCQLVDALPRDPHDQPVHGIETPAATIPGRR